MKEPTATEQIEAIITQYGGWKGALIAELRAAILAVDASLVEEVKWKMRTRPEGLPVWSSNGIVCLAETFKNDIKLVFTKGAYMENLQPFFNARLQSSTDRAIEFHEGDTVPVEAIQRIVAEGVRLNAEKATSK